MQCPRCNNDMRFIDREGLRLEVCEKCRGAWLDAPELERLLDRSSRGLDSQVRHYDDHNYHERPYDDHDRYREHRRDHDSGSDDDFRHGKHGYSGHGRRRGMLGRLFDMLD